MTKKLITIIVVLILFEILIIYTGRNAYLNGLENGSLGSAIDLVTKRHVYLFVVSMVLGPIGLIVKDKIGWIFTASFFYLINMGNLIAITISGINSNNQIPLFLILMAVTLTPLIYLNSSDMKEYFRIEIEKYLIRENLLAIGLVALTGGLFFVINM